MPDIQVQLHQIFATIDQTQGDPKAVYVLLQQQVFTYAHLSALETEWNEKLAQLPPKHHYHLAALFSIFADLIQQFPQGNRVLNLELSIQAYQLVLQVRTHETFPKDWAKTQNNLGNTYSDRLVGNRAENLELAIQCDA